MDRKWASLLPESMMSLQTELLLEVEAPKMPHVEVQSACRICQSSMSAWCQKLGTIKMQNLFLHLDLANSLVQQTIDEVWKKGKNMLKLGGCKGSWQQYT